MRQIFLLVGKIATVGFERTEKELKGIDKQAKKVARQFDRMGKQATKLGKNLSKAVTLPLLAAGAAVIKFGADFDQAMTNSIAIMGDVSKATRDEMELVARSIGKKFKFSATQAAEAYFFLASAGLDAAQSMAALPQVAAFAQAGNFDLARATDLLTDAQSALGLTSKNTAKNLENMTHVSDVLVKANTLANASVLEFSEALTNKAGAALRLLKKDVEEGAAVLLVYADQGEKGIAAGEKLNIVLRDLQKAAVNNEKAFKDANIEVFDGNGKMKNMGDIVGDLENRLLSMSDKERRVELATLGFTDKSISATTALLGTSDAIKEYETNLRSAAGVTKEVADKQIKNFWDQLGLLKDRLIDVALTIWKVLQPILMDKLIPALSRVAEKVAAAAEWFAKLDPAMQETILIALALVAAIGPLVFIIGKLTSAGALLIPLFVKLITGQLGLNAAMMANPIGFVITLIALLVAAGVFLVKNWDMVKTKFLKIWETIMFGVKQAISFMKQMIFSYMRLSINILNTIGRFIPGISGLLDKAKKKLDELIESEKVSRKERSLARWYTKIQAKEQGKLNEIVKAAKTATDEHTKAEKKNTIGKKAQTKATKGQSAAEKKLAAERKKRAEERADFEADFAQKIREETLNRLELLEYEKQQALIKADELGASRLDVEKFYAMKRLELQKQIASEILTETTNLTNKTFGVISDFNQNKIDLIDNEMALEKERILASTMGEEEKAAAIANIEEKSEIKKRALRQKAAKTEKAQGIFSVAISTAQAVMKGFAQLGPIAGVIAQVFTMALGAAQIAAIAAKPLPMKEGALIKGGKGGIFAEIGEGKHDEIIMDVQTGIDAIVDGIMNRMGAPVLPGARTAPDGAGPGPSPGGPRRAVFDKLVIGTLIANEYGFKELQRRLLPYQISEAQRKGDRE